MVLTDKQRTMYKRFFSDTDKDGSGALSIQELNLMLNKKLKLNLSNAEIIEMFQGCDANGDGQITLTEYMSEMEKINPNDLEEADLKRAFEEIDADKSGRLDKAEIKKLFEMCGQKVNNDQVETVIKKLDKDGDGQIAFDEFLKLWKKK